MLDAQHVSSGCILEVQGAHPVWIELGSGQQLLLFTQPCCVCFVALALLCEVSHWDNITCAAIGEHMFVPAHVNVHNKGVTVCLIIMLHQHRGLVAA